MALCAKVAIAGCALICVAFINYGFIFLHLTGLVWTRLHLAGHTTYGWMHGPAWECLVVYDLTLLPLLDMIGIGRH